MGCSVYIVETIEGTMPTKTTTHTMKNYIKNSAHVSLSEWVEQMRALCIQNKHSVKINYDNEQAVASFYVKGELVDTRRLFRL